MMIKCQVTKLVLLYRNTTKSFQISVNDELEFAKADRLSSYIGRTAGSIADDMERIITEAEHGSQKA
jgi:hypothetical protein